ncbi:MAG: helix-turn-helix domain-containing protein [Candidatus Obscuribacterales bacterium]|nr:helix-turn-helix domain-containing protein [Candidatus Obscuribacterales bacterium]
MDLKKKLQDARRASRFSQEQVAKQLGVTREVVSQWESGTRTPSVKNLEQLVSLYRAPYLVDPNATSDPIDEEKSTLVKGLHCEDDALNSEVSNWLDFLDRWSSYKKNDNDFLPQRGKPPKRLDKGIAFKDSRYAAREAQAVRDHFKLGREAIPNLYMLLDDWDILVYKANLGRWKKGQSKEGISGAFFNHPDLGYCIIVNAQTTPGRQTYTLAHELAHAFYHYSLRTIVSRAGNRDPLETFADTFASHFLVPTKSINALIDDYGWKNCLDPFKVIHLASCFQVSWLFLLYRLQGENHISRENLSEWSGLSPSKLADAMGIDTHLFTTEANGVKSDLHRFPPSVLSDVRDALEKKKIDRYQAAELLGVDDGDKLYNALCETSPADSGEQEAKYEFELQLAGGRI